MNTSVDSSPQPHSVRRDLIWILALVFLAVPDFFDTYRLMVLKAVSYDDYAPLLLRIMGLTNDPLPAARYVHRILSIVPAIPFYFLPVLHFSSIQESGVSQQYLKASQAIALVSWLSVVAASVIAYCFARRRSLSATEAAIASLASLLLSRFLALTGVDAIAVLTVLLLVIMEIEKWQIGFVLLSCASIVINEKILILLALYYGYLAIHNRRFRFNAVTAMTCFLGYWLARKGFRLPGGEFETQGGSLFANLLHAGGWILTPRSLILNFLPFSLLICLLLWVATSAHADDRLPATCIALSAMFVVSVAANGWFNVGRVVMHGYPLVIAYYVICRAATRGGTDGKVAVPDGLS